MAKVRVELNREGVRELLKSKEVEKMCMDYAESAVTRLGDGYEADTRHYPERTASIVVAKTYQAQKDNMKNNSILKALR